MKISKADLGWMAAVVDVKGHVVRKNNKSRNTPQLVLIVDAKDSRIATRLSRLTGTKPDYKHPVADVGKFMRRGCVEHCPQAHVHVSDEHPWNAPVTTRWTLTGTSMAIVLTNLSPYMSTFAEYQGYVDMVMASMVTEGKGSGMVKASVQRLAQLGWVIPAQVSRRLGEAA